MELLPSGQSSLCCIWYAIPALVLIYIMYVTRVFKYLSQWWFARCMHYLAPKYNKAVADDKKELFSRLCEDKKDEMTILEIGAGSGGSLDFYPDTISVKLVTVEPNAHFLPLLQENLKKYDMITLDRHIVCHAENMKEIESNSIDAVISTLVLCSVDDQKEVLREIKRVLKPGSRFYFMEHVAGEPGSRMETCQTILNKLWNVLFDGCNVNRSTWVSIDNAGFSKLDYRKFMADKLGLPFYVSYPHIAGYAEK